MTKPYIKLEKNIDEALASFDHVFLAGSQAEGKTYTAIKHCINNYKNTAFISDTHKLNNEININFMKDRNLIMNNIPHFANLFGMDFDKIPPEIQRMHGFPAACLCNFWKNPEYYLKKLNYFPEDWCQNHCDFKDNCAHKDMIFRALESLKFNDVHVVWLMVKAYIENKTNMLDVFLEVQRPVGIIDENILGLCYEQATLNAGGIRRFNDLAELITRTYSSLRPIYRDLREIFMLIDMFITYERDTAIKVRAKKIAEKLKEFLNSYKIQDIEKWNNEFKAMSLKHPGRIGKIYNIMDLIIKILQDCQDNTEFENGLTMDRDNPVITLFISKVEMIREIVHSFYKLIFTDALLPTVITEITTLLQLGDNYKLLHDTSLKAKWKEVKIYNLNNRRGAYPKNTLLTLPRDDVSQSFHNLIKIAKQILQFEAERNRIIGLIGSMKIFQYNRFETTIQKELAPIIEEYDMDVSFQHYGAAPGENTYDNINWVIPFGGYNIPLRDREIMSTITSINMDKLEYLHGPGTLIQFAHRGRALQRPDEVSVYFLTNQVKGYFEQEESFRNMPTIAYKNLIEFIRISVEVATTEIMEKLNKPRQSVLNILNYLRQQKIIDYKTEPSRSGRPDKIWFIW